MRNAEKDAADSEGEGSMVGKGRDRFLYLGTKTFLSQGCFCVRRGGERKITYVNNVVLTGQRMGKEAVGWGSPLKSRPSLQNNHNALYIKFKHTEAWYQIVSLLTFPLAKRRNPGKTARQ